MKENTELIKQMRIFAKQHNVPCISSQTESFLIQHLMKYKPRYCLEIGTAIGCSTQIISSTIADRQGSIMSFEISHPSYMTALWFQYQAHVYNMCIYHGDFLSFPLVDLITHPLEFVFIDGAKAHYHLFLEKILPYCAPGAQVICDDVGAFADKVHPLYSLLDKLSISYTQHETEPGDALLHIHLP